MSEDAKPDGSALFLTVSVSDTGIGMTPEQLERVFNEFEQAEGSTARRFGGTGLGLSITQQLLALMGGTISMDSRRGQGTRVTIILPVARADAARAKAYCADRTGAPLRPPPGLRVLLADDNATNRRILDAMLRGLDAKVTQACDGLDVVRRYAPGRFDVLLLDISMPGIDGIQALELIRLFDRANGATALPAIAISANAMRHQVEEYLAAGFAGHVAKPFRGQTLAAALADVLPPFSSP
jgi:CheY-like chemotaxis protein